MDCPRLALVAAVARNGVIGRDNDLPWRLKSDLARFKEVTLGKPVLMGRNTWESLPKRPLPGRANFVISRRFDWRPEGARLFSDFPTALAAARTQARATGGQEVCVIGGAGLYRDAMPLADRLYLTDIAAEPDGDVLFPAFDRTRWRETNRAVLAPSDGDTVTGAAAIWERA